MLNEEKALKQMTIDLLNDVISSTKQIVDKETGRFSLDETCALKCHLAALEDLPKAVMLKAMDDDSDADQLIAAMKSLRVLKLSLQKEDSSFAGIDDKVKKIQYSILGPWPPSPEPIKEPEPKKEPERSQNR